MPLIVTALAPEATRLYAVPAASLIVLACFGALAARAGGARLAPGALRVAFWGALAMGVTAGAGSVFGAIVSVDAGASISCLAVRSFGGQQQLTFSARSPIARRPRHAKHRQYMRGPSDAPTRRSRPSRRHGWPLAARGARRSGRARRGGRVRRAGVVLGVKTPALVVGVVRNGETSIQGFGRSADGTSAEPDGNTLCRIGSVTKAFTGQVLASLAADGVVSLADPLTKYVPEFITPLLEGGRPIRLIDLATHSAGLPREVPHEAGPPDNPFVNITAKAFEGWLKANPLLYTPGASILYSNFGFDLLAAALSAAARKPYPELIAERAPKPLGLEDTTFAPSPDQAQRLMQGHWIDGSAIRMSRPAR